MIDELLQRGDAFAMFTQGNGGSTREGPCFPWNPPTVRSSFNYFKGGEKRNCSWAFKFIPMKNLKILETARLDRFF
jgi:hypothetical protein